MCNQLTVTQKPRIAILSLHSCPLGNLGAKDTGGMSVYIREAATELAKLGFEIDIFTRKLLFKPLISYEHSGQIIPLFFSKSSMYIIIPSGIRFS